MQTSSKKRKIENSPENDDDDDWGEDLTAEEFDFLQSQIVENMGTDYGGMTSTTEVGPATNKVLEEQLVKDGKIRMLQLSLDQKTRELEKEREARNFINSQHLKDTEEKQMEYRLNIDQLQSALKFKDHELNKEIEKVKEFERRLRKLESGVSNVAVPSPFKLPVSASAGRLSSVVKPVHSSTQTLESIISDEKSCCLLMNNSNYNNIKHRMTYTSTSYHSGKSDFHPPCKFASGSHQKVRNNNSGVYQILTVSQIQTDMLPKLRLSSNCLCRSKLTVCDIKEAQVLCNFETQLRHYRMCFQEYVQHSDSDSSGKSSPSSSLGNFSSEQTSWTALVGSVSMLLANLCVLLSDSKPACSILIKSMRISEEPNDLSNELIDVFPSSNFVGTIIDCGTPSLSGLKLLKGSAVDWALKALNTIARHCDTCCADFFIRVVQDMNLSDILRGNYSVETAYLALLFLSHCVQIRDIFVHKKDACVLSSMVELLKRACGLKNSLDYQIQICRDCLNLVTSLIRHQSVTTFYNTQCFCISGILNHVLTWVFEQKISNEVLLLEVFQLTEILYRYLDSDMWFDLRSRMGDNYISTLNSACRSKMSALKEVALEQRERESPASNK